SARQAFKNFELFGAPHAAVITVDVDQGPYAVLDTGVYVAKPPLTKVCLFTLPNTGAAMTRPARTANS
ncbi:hypothetical protein, partial [Actinomadura sp. LOL_011]